MINQVTLCGRLGKDPEIEVVGKSNNQKMRFSIATEDSYKDKDGVWVNNTEWHQITVWNKVAEYVAKRAIKGSVIMVTGMLKTRKWQDNNGNDRYDYHVEPRQVRVLTGKKVEGEQEPPRSAAPSSQAQGGNSPPSQEDDLPF